MKLSSKFIVALSLAGTFSSFAQASHGVEKVLPADAHNYKLVSVEPGYWANGLKLISEGNIDGPVYEDTYELRMVVHMTYESKDDTDAPKTGSGTNGEFGPWDNTKPEVLAFIKLSDNDLAQLKNKQVKPADLVSYTVTNQVVPVADGSQEYVCRYDGDTNHIIDDGCVEPPQRYNQETRPVLDIEVK